MADNPKGRILVVDDEPDVCEMVVDVLSDYDVDVAGFFDEAKEKLSSSNYDVVILDIMGVNGHELLDLYGQKFPCIMLTAHALTTESFKKSVGGHARLFLPKEELANLEEYVEKVHTTKKSLWGWLVKKVDFRQWFGMDFDASDILKDLTMEDVMEDLDW